MNMKNIIIFSCLFLMFFAVLSSSSATDIASNATLVGVDDNQNDLQATDTQQEILRDSSNTFAQLDGVVNNASISPRIRLS